MEDLEKALSLIEREKNILVLPNPQFNKDSFSASLALFYGLREFGKNVNLKINSIPEDFKLLIGENFFPFSDYAISLRTEPDKNLEVFYKKTDNFLTFYLKTDQKIEKEDIIFENLKKPDLLISLGISKREDIEKLLENTPEKIINIDNNLENQLFGKINLVLEDFSISEIVFEILRKLRIPFSQVISDSLLIGITASGISFNSSFLEKTSFLTERAKYFPKIFSSFYKFEEKGLLKFFGKILSRIKVIPEKNLAITFLSKKDFQQTNSSPRKLKYFLEKVKLGIFPFENFLCLWESHFSEKVIKGVVFSQKEDFLEKFLENFQGKRKGNMVLFKIKELDFKKAKEEILAII